MPALTMKESPKLASNATEKIIEEQIRCRAFDCMKHGAARTATLSKAEIGVTGNATPGAAA